MFNGNAMDFGLKGYHQRDLAAPWAKALRSHVNELPKIGKPRHGGQYVTFDVSGYPVILVRLAGGLPVGQMFVTRHFDERNVLRAAAALSA